MKILDRSGSDSGSGGIGIYVAAPAPAPAVGKMSQYWDIFPTDQVKVPLSPLWYCLLRKCMARNQTAWHAAFKSLGTVIKQILCTNLNFQQQSTNTTPPAHAIVSITHPIRHTAAVTPLQSRRAAASCTGTVLLPSGGKSFDVPHWLSTIGHPAMRKGVLYYPQVGLL